MKLFINNGGRGIRMGSLTDDLPKPMLPVNGKPILHHLVDWAKKYNFSEIVMMNGYLAQKIVDYFEDGSKFNIKITHSNEPKPLGSGGAIKFAEKHVDDTFAYLSGDHICLLDFNKMLEFHKSKNSDFTVLVHQSDHPHDSDILQMDENDNIIKFISKHDQHINCGNLSNSGLCIIHPKVIGIINKEIFNFENYLYPKVIEKRIPFFAYHSEEFMKDIGNIERLKNVEEYLKKLENGKE